MAEAEIQAILDPTTTGRGIKIVRAFYDLVAGTTTWLITGGFTYVGKAKLITTTTADSDATQAAAIDAAMAL